MDGMIDSGVVDSYVEPTFEHKLSAEQKVELIIKFLQDKWNPKEIKKRISVSGFIDEPMYSLTLTLSYSDFAIDRPMTISGDASSNILEVYDAFLKRYWRDRDRQIDLENNNNLTAFERDMTLPFLQKEEVCMSEAELLLKSQIKGYI